MNKMAYQNGARSTMSKLIRHMIANTSFSIRSSFRSRIFRIRMCWVL